MSDTAPPIFLDPPNKPARAWTTAELATYCADYKRGGQDRLSGEPYQEGVSIGWQEGWQSADFDVRFANGEFDDDE